MPNGDFVWCDLSAYDVEGAKSFYGDLLGWRFSETAQPDGVPYHIAWTDEGECAALFDMPGTFRDMGLPSFWMSYIQVDDIDRTVTQARDLGGKVEFGPQDFGDGAAIALIRDPLGAGFTLYQGEALPPRGGEAHPGQMAWNALHVSDAEAVAGFYASLFDWQIARGPWSANSHDIRNARGELISAIIEQGEVERGGYQYWGVTFAVRDLEDADTRLAELGGRVLAQEVSASGPVLAAQDGDGAAFFLVAAR